MTPEKANSILRPLVTVIYAMIAGQILFLAVSYFIIFRQGGISSPEEAEALHNSIFIYMAPILTVVMIAIAFIFYFRRLQSIRKLHSLETKLNLYQRAIIVRSAFLNGCNLFLIFSFLTTGQPYYLLFFLPTLLLYILIIPNATKAAADLQLSAEEQKQLGL